MTTKVNSKKVWLDKVYYEFGKQQYDFFVAGTYKKNGETHFTKWKKFSDAIFPIDIDGTSDDWKDQKFFEQINQRQILPNELVLDIEEKKQIKPIVKILKNLKSINVNEYCIYETGSRGYHIHIFLSNEDFNEREKLFLVKKFGADIQKCSDKCLIALENCPHWKTGKNKKQISGKEILNDK